MVHRKTQFLGSSFILHENVSIYKLKKRNQKLKKEKKKLGWGFQNVATSGVGKSEQDS